VLCKNFALLSNWVTEKTGTLNSDSRISHKIISQEDFGFHMKTINLQEKLSLFDSHWDPHVVSDYNSNDVMVVKFSGEYPFHKHDTTDDFFLVLEGEMIMDIEGEESRTVKAGELFVVPKGVVHRPRAESEVKVLLIEPKGEPNSGDSDRQPAPKHRI
jgi:mannose-6-phosphate isomerase-like protein (cupin superfamily)